MQKISYPQGLWTTPEEPFNLKKWNETLKKIILMTRKYRGHYSRDDIVKQLIKQWEKEEQEHFQQWLKYKEKYERGCFMNMKMASYDPYGDKEQGLVDMKSKMRSRITSIERLFTTLLDEALIEKEKALYIGRILQKLKEEINVLESPKLVAACQEKARTLLNKVGFVEASSLLSVQYESRQLVRTAQTAVEASTIQPIITKIKEEIDQFNYAEHLRKLMAVALELDKIGRHSEANDVIEVIKKDLDSVDAVHKKLSEVYLTLGQIPLQKKQEVPVAEPQEPREEPRRALVMPTPAPEMRPRPPQGLR